MEFISSYYKFQKKYILKVQALYIFYILLIVTQNH